MAAASRLASVLLGIVAASCAGEGPPGDVTDATDAAGEVADVAADLPAEAVAPGPPRDLVPFARLRASATATDGLWVREAEESIATVRDDFADTGWRPPAGAEAVVEIDLQPWLGRSVRIDEVSIAWTGNAPSAVSVALLDACGGTARATLPWPAPSTPLDAGARIAGCVQLRLTGAATTVVTGIHVASRDATIGLPELRTNDFALPGTSFPGYGLIEGFYGRPWSWDERERLMVVLAMHGLTAYMYAPKDDPLHRHLWREPYPAGAMDRFEALGILAAKLGVTSCFGISPFLDFDFSTDADYQALLSKARAFADRGFPCVGILADDIEFEADVTMDGTLGKRHADLSNRLLADLRADHPDVRFWFTPTVYSDERLADNPGGEDYLEAVAALDPSVEVLWTGRKTSSSTMTAADMATVTALVGRKPLIWDNYWANDGGDGFFGRILAAAFSGRGPDLPPAVAGIAHNPSIQGSLDRLTLSMFASWIRDPANSERESQVAHAIEVEQLFATGAGRSRERDAATLRLLLDVFDGHANSDPAYRAMEAAIDALLAAVQAPGLPIDAAWDALRVFAGMAALPSDLWHSGLDAGLADDLAFPVEAPRWLGEQGLWSLALLGARLSGADGSAALAEAEAAAEQARHVRFTVSIGRVQALNDAMAALAPEPRGFVAMAAGEDVPPCRPGESWSWTPFAGDAGTVEARGLPGAVSQGATLAWTPPHAGRYHAVAIARGPAGWGFRIADPVCEPAP
jgi:hyaluronoglucosaminidase